MSSLDRKEVALGISVAGGVSLLFLLFAFAYSLYAQLVQDNDGFSTELVEKIPGKQSSFGHLAKSLSEHNRQTYEEIKREFHLIESYLSIKQRYPERFTAPLSWFEAVASAKEIPDHQIEKLIALAQEKPLSTDDAGNWLSETYKEMETTPAKAAQRASQQQGIVVLQERLEPQGKQSE